MVPLIRLESTTSGFGDHRVTVSNILVAGERVELLYITLTCFPLTTYLSFVLYSKSETFQ